jgi:hypothetical protein
MRRCSLKGDIMPTSFLLLSNSRPCGPLDKSRRAKRKGFVGATYFANESPQVRHSSTGNSTRFPGTGRGQECWSGLS